MGELLHLRIDSKMRTEIKKLVKNNLFSNETEFIRDSIRKNIETYNKINTIKSLRGSLTKNSKKQLKHSDVFGSFGLED